MPDTSETYDRHERKRSVQSMQSRRLHETYADLKDNPQFAPIGRFFFDQLYGPEDFSFRDDSIRKLHRVLKGAVQKRILSAVSRALELQELSDELDDRMVEAMIARQIGPDLSPDQYRQIFRSLDNYDERRHQIELTLETLAEFHRLSRMWMVGVTLKTVQAAANLMGVGRIMDFVRNGYESLRAIGNLPFLLDTLRDRETAWLDALWQSEQRIEPQTRAARRNR